MQLHGAPFAVDVDAQAGRRFFQLGLDLALAQPQEIIRQVAPPPRSTARFTPA
jgi:hypothetical protein